MERPKPTYEKPQRIITGEVMYLDEMRRLGQFPKSYLDLSDMAIQMYEGEADLARHSGIRPEIMDAYEVCDAELTPLEMRCRALIDKLFSYSEYPSGYTYQHIHVESSPEDVLTTLKSMSVGKLLADDDRQLARGPSEYYGVHDIKKCDSQLIDVGAVVWQWRAPGVTRDPFASAGQYGGRSLLHFPADEPQVWGQLDITFSYLHPKEGEWYETFSLYQGIAGEVSLSGSTWLSAYAETGYEGDGHQKGRLTDQQAISEFADLIAELVGDEPISEQEYIRREFTAYLQEVKLAESGVYLREWAENMWPSQVLYELHVAQVGPLSLHEALVADRYAHEAHAQLVQLVDAQRSSQNLAAASQSDEMRVLLGELQPWRDTVVR